MIQLLLTISPWLAFVYDYSPAPGQFINEVPEITAQASHAEVLEIVSEQLTGSKMPGMVSLGSFGGSVTVGFDHPVVNVPGVADFMLYGNAISNGAEPGIIMVAKDENNNGIPDDTWYELRGSIEDNPDIEFNYTITYHKPQGANPVAHENWKFVTDAEYIRWEDNRGESGYVMKISSHTQSYWPEWINEDQISFSGTRLPDIAVCENVGGSLWTVTAPDWGYADSKPNNQETGFDISNAVDSQRNPVNLDQIDFIRIYSATNQFRGWLGEASTEIAGGEDLHPDAEPSGVTMPKSGIHSINVRNRTLTIISEAPQNLEIYNASGNIVYRGPVTAGENKFDLNSLAGGIYLAKCGKVVKFAL